MANRGEPAAHVARTSTRPSPSSERSKRTFASREPEPSISSICHPTAGDAPILTVSPEQVADTRPPRVTIVRLTDALDPLVPEPLAREELEADAVSRPPLVVADGLAPEPLFRSPTTGAPVPFGPRVLVVVGSGVEPVDDDCPGRLGPALLDDRGELRTGTAAASASWSANGSPTKPAAPNPTPTAEAANSSQTATSASLRSTPSSLDVLELRDR